MYSLYIKKENTDKRGRKKGREKNIRREKKITFTLEGAFLSELHMYKVDPCRVYVRIYASVLFITF